MQWIEQNIGWVQFIGYILGLIILAYRIGKLMSVIEQREEKEKKLVEQVEQIEEELDAHCQKTEIHIDPVRDERRWQEQKERSIHIENMVNSILNEVRRKR